MTDTTTTDTITAPPWLDVEALGIAELAPRAEALMDQLCSIIPQLQSVLDECGALMVRAKEAGADR